MEIEKIVKEIVADVCQTIVSQINGDTSIGDYPQWDSVGHLAILSAAEDAFNINFEAEDMMEIESVDDIINAIRKNLKMD